MSLRWSERETEALTELRKALKDDLAGRPQYPDVVGDRRMLRFLRGKQYNVPEAAKMFSAFLKWRDENNVDDIRNQILFGGLDTPYKFPSGKKIIDLAPQIIISAKAQDYKGQPLVLEQYSFSPSDMFARVTIKDYLLFLVYGLEYRALVMEQMSHEREQKYLAEHPEPDDRADGYGVVLLNFCIRDLQGVGISHLTGKGKQIIEAAINIGLPNYPEYLGKCHMINVPWVFTSMWFFIKGLLDDFILAKINLTGTKYMDTLLKDMPIESIPKALGGKFELYNEPFSFDTSPTGPFYSERRPKPLLLPRTGSAGSLQTTTVTTAASYSSGSAVDGTKPTTLTVLPSPRNDAAHSSAPTTPRASSGAGSQQQQPEASPAVTVDSRARAVSPSQYRVNYSSRGAAVSPTLTREALATLNKSNSPAKKGAPGAKGVHKLDSWSSGYGASFYIPKTTTVDAAGCSSQEAGGGWAWQEGLRMPAALGSVGLLCLLLVSHPWATIKYIIVPVLFTLFVVYVV